MLLLYCRSSILIVASLVIVKDDFLVSFFLLCSSSSYCSLHWFDRSETICKWNFVDPVPLLTETTLQHDKELYLEFIDRSFLSRGDQTVASCFLVNGCRGACQATALLILFLGQVTNWRRRQFHFLSRVYHVPTCVATRTYRYFRAYAVRESIRIRHSMCNTVRVYGTTNTLHRKSER